MTIRVFLAADRGVVRGGLRAVINSQSDMRVVGEASDGISAEQGILETRPDVALLELPMPGRDGLETIKAVRQKRPMTRVLVLTVHDEAGSTRAAMEAGALGHVVKSAAESELLGAIHAVVRGRVLTEVSMVSAPIASRSVPPGRSKTIDLLSNREHMVLGLVAEGCADREIAELLHIGVKSVGNYHRRVMKKLGLSSRSELVRFALEYGILMAGTSP